MQSSFGRLLAWVGIALLVLYMTIGEGSGWYGVYSAVLRTFSIAAIAAVFATWLLAARRSPAWRPRTVLWPPIVAVLVAFLVTSVTSSQARIGFEYTAYAVLLAGLYLLLVRLLAQAFFRVRLLGLVALLCGGICAWYLWTVAGIWVQWWGLVGHIAIPPLRPDLDGLVWRSPNTVAIMAILLLPPVLASFAGPRRGRAIALAALTLLVLVTVFVTGSRGAWLGLAAGVAATVVLWLAVPGHPAAVRTRLATLPIRRGPTLVLGVLAALAGLVAAPLIAARAGAGGEDLRSDLIATAIRIFQGNPLTGDGPGSWVVNRLAFTRPDERDYYIPHAHNIYAQALAEFGLIGAVAGLVVAIWLIALIWDGVRDADPVRRRFAWAACFSTVYYGVHQLVDVYVGLPCVLFAFALPIAYLDATSSRPILGRIPRLRGGAAPSDAWRWAPAGLLAVSAASALAFLAWSETNALAAEDAVGSANTGDWSQAARAVDAAHRGDPGMPAYDLIAGLAQLHEESPRTAIPLLERAVAADDFPATWLDLAAARADIGDADGARAALSAALRIGEQQPSIAFGAGTVYLRLGDSGAATDAFGRAIRNAPTLVGDPYFQTGDGAPYRSAALSLAMAAWPPDAWENALLAGDPGDAARRAASLSGSARARAGQVIAAFQGDAAARSAIEAAARSSPLDLQLVAWSARLARRSGDETAARRYRQWADTVLPGSGDLGEDLRVTSGSRSFPGYGGIDTSVFGLYTYRRPMPVDLLAPSLPHLVLQ